MSLINDALKRTQQNTQSQVPPRLNEMELRPIEPSSEPPASRRSVGKFLVWLAVLIVLVANSALWFVFKHRSPAPKVEARVAEPAAAPVLEPEPSPAPAQIAVPESQPQTVPEPTVTASSETQVVAPVIEEIEASVPAARPDLKLKTIVSHPTRPSAMINNRVVFVGERVANYTITRIDTHSVTLTCGGDTMTLTLP